MADKYPDATFAIDAAKRDAWLQANPNENLQSTMSAIRWLAVNGDRAGCLSYPFVTTVTLGPSSR